MNVIKTNQETNMNTAAEYSITIAFSRKSSVPRIKCILCSKSVVILSQRPGIMGERKLEEYRKEKKRRFNHISLSRVSTNR